MRGRSGRVGVAGKTVGCTELGVRSWLSSLSRL